MKLPRPNLIVVFIILVLIVLCGSFSSVNKNGAGSIDDNFFSSVAIGIRHGDVLLIICAVLTLLLVVWFALFWLPFTRRLFPEEKNA